MPDEQKAVQFLTASQIAGMFLAASTCRVPVVTKEAEMRLHPIANCVSHVLGRSSSAAYLMLFAVAVVGVCPAVAAGPPGLTGEDFQASSDPSPLDLPGDVTILAARCDPDSAFFAYRATGPAIGPYPGTFEELGVITAGAVGTETSQKAGRTVLSAHAIFTITSPVGQVQGIKNLDPHVGDAFSCQVSNIIDVLVSGIFLTYQATIRTASGTFLDSGQSSLFLQDIDVGYRQTQFDEDFVSSGPPIPIGRGRHGGKGSED